MADVLSSRESLDVRSINQDSESEILQMAAELCDQGFGEFDLCLTVLTAKKGNLKKAQNALSKLIFTSQRIK